MTTLKIITLGLFLALTLSSCAQYQPDYSGKGYIDYQTSAVEGTVAHSKFRIAVLPFADHSAVIELRSEAARQESEYYQFRSLLPWVLAEELRHNQVGKVVDVAPVLVDDYDLLVKGQWAVRESKEDAAGTTLKAGFAVYRPNTTKPLYEKSYKSVFEKKQWVNISMAEKVAFLRQATHNFIRDAEPVITGLTGELTDKSRRFGYYQHLDPELTLIGAAISKNKRGGNQRAASQLLNEYKLRLGYLEAYRAKEWDVLADQNSYREQAYRERLQEIARYVKERNRLQAEMARQQAAIDDSRRKQQNAALASILMAAQGASKAGVSDVDVLTTALTDMGTALQNLPPPPVLKMDDALLNQEIDLRGLHDFSTDTFGKLEGSSLVDIRKKFLALYRRKASDMSRYF